jgi:hypothetical protein
MNLLRNIFAIVLVTGCLATSTYAVKTYRLRSNINPGCATTSALKYADIHADGNLAVMGSYNCRGVFIFDISNPDAPVLRSWYNPGANIQFLEAIVIGNRGYFGAGNGTTNGVHIVDLTNPASPQLLGIVNAANGGHATIHEMMVFDQADQRYLLINSNSTATRSLKILNVTNPAVPVLKYTFNSTDNGWVHAMHIRGNRMFLSGFSSSTRVDIYDISNLAATGPAHIGTVPVGLGSNHSTWTSEDGNFLYSAREISNSDVTNPGDIRVYDISEPSTPLLVKRVSMNDLGIVAVTPHNPVVMGDKLYVSWYQAGTQVFDISEPWNPVRIGEYDTWPVQFTEQDLENVKKTQPEDVVCGVDQLTNTMISGYNGNWAVYPFLGEDKVLLGDLTTGLYVIDVSGSGNPISDFDGDGRTDLSVFNPASGNWSVERSSDSGASTLWWGQSEDIPVASDYDGDGKADHAIFRPSTGTWWFVMSSNGSRPAVNFGMQGDIPITGDYDGDGKTDIAVFRPSTGVWYILRSTGGVSYVSWGLDGDKPIPMDHDGDGKTDIAVWRPSTGVWYVVRSSDNGFVFFAFGTQGDRPLVADLNGDGRSEFSVFRPSEGIWYFWDPSNSSYFGFNFGLGTDIPVPADYDGDGKTDVAVFRPESNTWYRLNSSNQAFIVRSYGNVGDIPSPSSVQPN